MDQTNSSAPATDDVAVDDKAQVDTTETSYEALKSIIQNLSVKLDELREKQKEYRQISKNILDNDSQLSAYEEQAKEAQLQFKKRKKELMESVEAKEAAAKAKEVGEEMRDIQDSLTNHLLNYYQITGVRSFDTPSGDEREFVFNARLKPPKR